MGLGDNSDLEWSDSTSPHWKNDPFRHISIYNLCILPSQFNPGLITIKEILLVNWGLFYGDGEEKRAKMSTASENIAIPLKYAQEEAYWISTPVIIFEYRVMSWFIGFVRAKVREELMNEEKKSLMTGQ